jgi:hypothetical protein
MDADTTAKFLIPLAAAGLGFLANLLLDSLRRRREARRQLAYSCVETPIALPVRDDAVAPQLQLTYAGRPVSELHTVTYQIRNSGNLLLKDQYLRFEFSDRLRILDSGFVSPPAPELQAEAHVTNPVVVLPKPATALGHFKLGHLNPRDEVALFLLVEGQPYEAPVVHLYNPESEVEIVETSVQQVRAERERLASLIGKVATLSAIGALLRSVNFAVHLDQVLWGFSLYLIAREAEPLASALLRNKTSRELPGSALTA